MSAIDRIGTFRGKIIDRGIGESTNGYPQAILQLQATQLWDENEKVWQDWNYDEVDTVAYLTLVGGKGVATVSAKQLMVATGWDGMSFADFQENDKLKDEIQFRVEENTYEGNTTLRVNWVDAYDAEPGRKLRKLDKTGIAKLQAKYAGALTALSGGPKPKSAPPSAPTPASAPKPAAKPREVPEASTAPTAEYADPTPPFTPDTKTPSTTGNSPDSPPTEALPEPPAPSKAEKPKGKGKGKAKAKPIDMNTAWKQVFEACSKAGKTQLEITQAWTEAVKEAGGPDEIGDDWSGVAVSTTAALS